MSAFAFVMPIQNSPDGGTCRSSKTTWPSFALVVLACNSETVKVTGCDSKLRADIMATNPLLVASSTRLTPDLCPNNQKVLATTKHQNTVVAMNVRMMVLILGFMMRV